MNPLSAVTGAANLLSPEIPEPSASTGPFGQQTVSQWGPIRATRHEVGWWQTREEAAAILGRVQRFHAKAPRMGWGITAVATIAGCIFARVGNGRRKNTGGR